MSGPELHRGKLAQHPRIISVRPLTREDMEVLREKRVGPPRLVTLRDSHHRLARFCASGIRDAEICARTGYSQNRLSQLRTDPAFAQLVEEYRGKVEEAWIKNQDEFFATSVSNMLRAERMIEAELDKADDGEGEAIGLKTLLAITSDRADRFGYGKTRTQRNENIDFAAMMKDIAAQSGRSNVIDARPQPAAAVAHQGPQEQRSPSLAPAGNQSEQDLGPVSDPAVDGFRRRA